MRRLITRLSVAVLVAVLFAACVARPDQEVREAKAAIDAARAAGAEEYAASQYTAALTALRASEQALTQRENRQARGLALESRKQAQDAARLAAEHKETARADATRRLQELEAAVDTARQRVAAAEAPGRTRTRADQLALSETRRAIVVANVSLQKARTAIVSGDYTTARQATEGVADRLMAIAATKPATSVPPPVRGRK
jgi:hypothetical protein